MSDTKEGIDVHTPYAFADEEQYSNADLVRTIREGEIEINACENPRQRAAAEFMVRCALFEYHQRKYKDGTI